MMGPSCDTDAARVRLWTAALGVATMLHVAVALAFLKASFEHEPNDALAGSYVVELAPDYTTTAAPETALPIGVRSSESAENAPMRSSTTAAPEPELMSPAEMAPTDPEIALPKPTQQMKPLEAEMTSAAVEQLVSAASLPSVAAAPPRLEAPVAKLATAPQAGTSPQAHRAKLAWHRSLTLHLERFKRYPAAASDRRIPGTVLVEFTVDREGGVIARRVAQSSGDALLDAAALDMLRRATPLPRAPNDLVGDTFTLTVPVVFKLP